MKIVVCIKQVPDTTEIKIDKETGTLIRKGVPSIINPDDMHAIEEGLRLKEKFGGKTIVITMGPPQAEEALREALAMGMDEAIHLTDRAFAGADTLATSYVLGKAIQKIGDYDLIICGRQAIDGDTAQIGPQVAEFLNLPQVTYVRKVCVKDGRIIAERLMEHGYESIEARLPALITVVSEINKPRYPTVVGIASAFQKRIVVWAPKDIDADPNQIGLRGSPTQVKETSTPEWARRAEIIKGNASETASLLIQRLMNEGVIRV